MIIYGTDELFRVNLADGTQLASFPGVLSKIEQSSNEKDDIKARRERFVEESVCPECNGTRLKKDSLYFKIDGLDISQVSNFDIDELKEWIEQLPAKLNNKQNLIASDILKELRDRVGFLQDVGLNYLSLSRSTRSLSGGESQRIRLATQIGSKLVNVLYILDEPPRTATIEIQDKTFVYTIEDGKARAIPVVVTRANGGDDYIVTSGLNVGDVIITEGVGILREGTPITPKNASSTSK